jgi:hypothetical protein
VQLKLYDNGESCELLNFWLSAVERQFDMQEALATAWSSTTNANSICTSDKLNLCRKAQLTNGYITGVQLEAGTTATDFEFLPHDVNLQRCLEVY